MHINKGIEMAKQLNKANRAMQELQSSLSSTFEEFVVIGLRKREEQESRRDGEDVEKFWFISGNPLIVGGLVKWALESIAEKMRKGSVLDRLDENGLTPVKLEEIIKEMEKP